MKRLLALAALLIPIYLFGQGFGSFGHDQPFFARNITSSANGPCYSSYGSAIPCPSLRFVSSDLPINTAVSSWVDRVQGVAFTMVDTAQQPTNSASGVGFGGGQALTNQAGVLFSTNPVPSILLISNTVFIVMQPVTKTGDQYILGNDRTTTEGYGYQLNNATGLGRFNKFPGTLYSLFNYTASNRFDLIHISPTNYAGSWMTGYTNNIASIDANQTAFLFRMHVIGGVPLLGAAGYKGYIQEIAVWTNQVLSLTERSNLHHYATNTYLFSP